MPTNSCAYCNATETKLVWAARYRVLVCEDADACRKRELAQRRNRNLHEDIEPISGKRGNARAAQGNGKPFIPKGEYYG